ncbi:MAG: ABC transporter permease subunit, partial [Actinomycetia bacterium]|nr:ABC transporter permease subunit [Actinomycetes bacterium]
MAIATTTAPSDAPRMRNTTIPGLIVKVVFLALVLAAGVWAAPQLYQQHKWMWLGVLVAVIAGLVLLYSTKRFIPGKYLFPGTAFLCVLLIIPIILTVRYSFTNFGDGSRGTKQETIDGIVTSSVMPTATSSWYEVAVAVHSGADTTHGPFTLFLVKDNDDTDTVWVGADGETLAQWTGATATVAGGRVTAVPGYDILNLKQANAVSAALAAIVIDVPGDTASAIKLQGLRAFEGSPSIAYDAAKDELTTTDGKTYPLALVGNSYCFADTSDPTGCFEARRWLQDVGWSNYARLVTNANIRAEFLGAFGWNLIFAGGSVALTFILGFALALSLNDERIKGRRLWRSFLLLPYAVPGMISLLLWSNFFNKDFGLINQIFHTHLNWFGDPTLAKLAVFLVQLWMGFPYWFIVCTGALQSIPGDVKEAAQIDGATGLATTFRIVLPLLLISVAPLIVASFAFNFNNFNAIQLLTQGAP